MKCVMCEGKLEKKNVEHKEYGVSLGTFPALVCNKCNNVFYDSDIVDIIQTKSKEMGLFGLTKKTKVAKVGNSLAVRIPKEIALVTGLKKGKEVLIAPKGKNNIAIEF